MSRPLSRTSHGHEKKRDEIVTFLWVRDFFVTFSHEKVTFLLLVLRDIQPDKKIDTRNGQE